MPSPEKPSLSDAFRPIGGGLTDLLTSIGVWAHMALDVRYQEGRQRRRTRTLCLIIKGLFALFVISVDIAPLVFSCANSSAAKN
ncbi:hypothetical protein BWQ96_06027 [Gracilariopsis chorda]|uniref:Uncharacterized protein n=1 Tax=Gracilariopsis chorda TaxID=448386 RepID=A0A2V3IQ82_9FLOR|nr:hypothetical protein BWQ96_06027 [Gracilariopsis chorda]|eukprot:PXF44246.1 hypothetical protein BWQ96_06027 [Gracilariopsis chorda]